MKQNILVSVSPWVLAKFFPSISVFNGTMSKLSNRRNMILLLSVMLFPLTVSSQQLSYAYDAAGNRISRTIIVGAHNPSDEAPQDPSGDYVETLDGKQLTIHADREEPRLTITVGDYDASLKGAYSLLNREGRLLAGKGLSGENTFVELKELPSGSYTLQILLNGHPSEWEVIKL